MGRKASAEGRERGGSLSTEARRSVFVRTLTETGSVATAAQAADRKLSTCYRWRRENAGFAAQWDAALAIGYDRLEGALLDHALKTIERGLTEVVGGEPYLPGMDLLTRYSGA